jgi:3-oxo-5alpha-steroid 4-dehydrogenase
MDCCAATRFHCTPESLAAGVAVNADGRRFCDESLYGAAVNREITRQPRGQAWLVIDQTLHDRARHEMAQEPPLRSTSLRDFASGRSHNLVYRRLTAALNLGLNRHRAPTLRILARQLHVSPDELDHSIAEHNARLDRGEPDAFGKPDACRGPVRQPPFYAIDLRLANLRFPTPCFTLGGLRIDYPSARVLRTDGTVIPGLYAAGRNAAGVCASSYVSGLSIADAIFAGRNAGRHAQRRAMEQKGP